MEKEILLYNNKTDEITKVTTAQQSSVFESFVDENPLKALGIDAKTAAEKMTPETFTLKVMENGEVLSMTYNEWEAQRAQQGFDSVKAQLAEKNLPADKKAAVLAVLADFTEGMTTKYLKSKSWQSIYEELMNNLLK